MEWIDQVLAPFEWMRTVLPPGASGWDDFAAALVAYAAIMLLAGGAVYFLLRGMARLVEFSAKALAVGATTQDLVRLEASSARISWPLRRLASRIIRTGFSQDQQDSRLPRRGTEPTGMRIARPLLRALWLVGYGLARFAIGLVRFFLSGFGVVLVLAAGMTAFPDVVRAVAHEVAGFLAGLTWTEASAVTAATIAAAALPIALIVLRLLISETASATRAFRRHRDEDALMALYRARSAILALADATADLIPDTVRRYSIEQHHATEWYRWATRKSPAPRQLSWGDADDHTECHRECLDERPAPHPNDEQGSDVKDAVGAVEKAWADHLGESRPALAALMSSRARIGMTSLRLCMSVEGRFLPYKLPSPQEWRHRRISWQHGQLRYGSPDAADIAVRDVVVSTKRDPDEQWLERDLHDLSWDLAELSRELRDLAEFAYALTRRRRIEKLATASTA